ncbi:MAG: hypothetical protein RL260_2849 [Pseudomonadota bacterium]|jgi:hypothetical protein
MVSRRQFMVASATLAALAAAAPGAQALERPTGRVVLTISGRIGVRNAGTQAEFDMGMLAALPQHTLSTKTPWYPQAHTFTGPLLRDVLAAVQAQGKNLRAIALNDYKVDLPVADALKFNLVLARLMDDKPMPVRDKGPLFIIYPFDSDEALRNERYYGRSAWQLKALDVLE